VLKATIERRYKDKDGEWKSSNSYGTNELFLVIHVLQKAYEYMLEKRNSPEDKVEEETI
jgi:hypothetical protein